MDYNKKTARKITLSIALSFILLVGAAGGLWILAETLFPYDDPLAYLSWGAAMMVIIIILAIIMTKIVNRPLQMLYDVIVYAGHSSRGGTPPDTERLHTGRQLVTALARQVYDLASMSEQSNDVVLQSGTQNANTTQPSATKTPDAPVANSSAKILDHIGIPIIGLDSSQNVTMINRQAEDYLGTKSDKIIGKPFYDTASLAFQGDETFEQWLKNSQDNTAVGTRIWERVRISDETGAATKQFDLVASFSKGNQSGTETMLAIYDRTGQYTRDDGEISFVSLAVHELRTPLTIMRGYIEVFEDELGPTLNPELKGFMEKMQASAQQLTAFVGNILNVARVEENQLVLQLQQYMWPDIVNYAVSDLELRAQVHGKHIEIQTADDLPSVAVDRISIHEVINNLVDNAIKYSGDSDKIIISSKMNAEGMVEVSVQDFGIGIPSGVVSDLFQKFYRSHKSNIKVGGTGLGLYLSKALVNAHGGNIWVRSKEGEGSIFSFTIQPFDHVKHQHGDEDGIMRGAHGWIKNHSLNRQ